MCYNKGISIFHHQVYVRYYGAANFLFTKNYQQRYILQEECFWNTIKSINHSHLMICMIMASLIGFVLFFYFTCTRQIKDAFHLCSRYKDVLHLLILKVPRFFIMTSCIRYYVIGKQFSLKNF